MKNYYGVIYKATNKINGKSYVGQTIQSLSKRKIKHISDSVLKKETNSKFHNAIRKYGRENFNWQILKKCVIDDIDKEEIRFIEKFGTISNGYNIAVGGKVLRGKDSPQYGKPLSKETKDKLSKALSGPNNPMYGKTHSERARKLISMSRKKYRGKLHPRYGKPGYFAGKERPEMAGKNHPFYGKKRSVEDRAKIADGKSQYWLVYSPDGNKSIIKNLEKFCKFNNISSSHLYAVARGERNHHKNYKCKKLNEDIIRRFK